MTHYLCSNEFMILIDRKVLFPFDGPNCTRCYSCVRDSKYCGSFWILRLALQTEFVSMSMNFYQDGRACVMVGQDGAVHCGHGR